MNPSESVNCEYLIDFIPFSHSKCYVGRTTYNSIKTQAEASAGFTGLAKIIKSAEEIIGDSTFGSEDKDIMFLACRLWAGGEKNIHIVKNLEEMDISKAFSSISDKVTELDISGLSVGFWDLRAIKESIRNLDVEFKEYVDNQYYAGY